MNFIDSKSVALYLAEKLTRSTRNCDFFAFARGVTLTGLYRFKNGGARFGNLDDVFNQGGEKRGWAPHPQNGKTPNPARLLPASS